MANTTSLMLLAESTTFAKVAVLLISADFLASKFITEVELPPLLAAAEADGTVILPIIVGPSNFEDTELSQFQALNPPSKPLISMNGHWKLADQKGLSTYMQKSILSSYSFSGRHY